MSAPAASDTSPPGGAAVSLPTGGPSGSSGSSSSSTSAGGATIDQLIDQSDEARKMNPNAAPSHKATGYLQARIDMQKPILAAMLSECPPVLHPFLPYDGSYTTSIQVSDQHRRRSARRSAHRSSTCEKRTASGSSRARWLPLGGGGSISGQHLHRLPPSC
jgi:hypothetical protein